MFLAAGHCCAFSEYEIMLLDEKNNDTFVPFSRTIVVLECFFVGRSIRSELHRETVPYAPFLQDRICPPTFRCHSAGKQHSDKTLTGASFLEDIIQRDFSGAGMTVVLACILAGDIGSSSVFFRICMTKPVPFVCRSWQSALGLLFFQSIMLPAVC